MGGTLQFEVKITIFQIIKRQLTDIQMASIC